MTPPTERIIELVVAAVEAQQPVEVWGGGSLLSRLEVPDGAGRLDAGLSDEVVEYEPADLVVSVGAGMRVDALDELLEANGQECPLDSVGPGGSTVGGRVASGLGGPRQLGCGPVRDWVLGATFVTGDGQRCHAGGRTVKNVTGFDLPRMLCGSWGTLGILIEVTFRVRPRPRWHGWYRTDAPVGDWVRRLHAPVSILTGPHRSYVLLEGHPQDGEDQARTAGLEPCDAPELPGPVRLAVPAHDLGRWWGALPDDGWLAEWGVGVIHLDASSAVDDLRARADRDGARLLRFDGRVEPDLSSAPREPAFHRRLKDAFDPHGVLAPWRFPA